MAERGGFEPPLGCLFPKTVEQTAAFSRYATSPRRAFNSLPHCGGVGGALLVHSISEDRNKRPT